MKRGKPKRRCLDRVRVDPCINEMGVYWRMCTTVLHGGVRHPASPHTSGNKMENYNIRLKQWGLTIEWSILRCTNIRFPFQILLHGYENVDHNMYCFSLIYACGIYK